MGKAIKVGDRLCDWNPIRNTRAGSTRYGGIRFDVEGNCRNKAVVIVGKGGEWYLCDSCADMPMFKRYRVRRRIEKSPKKLHKKSKCTVYKEPCVEHGFYHGAEAEELRKGVEKICDDYAIDSEGYNGSDVVLALRRLLDKVDARDSLAYLEAKDTT